MGPRLNLFPARDRVQLVPVLSESPITDRNLDFWLRILLLLIAAGIQPNPKSGVQISIRKTFSAAFKEGSFVAIQLPRLPPFALA